MTIELRPPYYEDNAVVVDGVTVGYLDFDRYATEEPVIDIPEAGSFTAGRLRELADFLDAQKGS